MKTLLLSCFGLVLSLSAATDGTWLRGNSGNWDPGTNYGGFGKAGNWKDGIHAAGGGVVTFNGNANATVSQNVNGLQLGGMAFDARVTTVTGTGFSLVGDAPFIRFANSSTFQPNVAITGTGPLSVFATGVEYGTLGLGASGSLTGFESADIDSMLVTFGGAAAQLPSAVRLSSTFLAFNPAGAAGTAAATTVAADGLTVGPGRNYVKVVPGNTDSATLTLGPITRETGAVLDIRAEGGTLGGKAIVKTTSAPTLTNGIVDPWIVSCPTADFLTYDATVGFKPATDLYSATPAADKVWHANDIETVSSDTTVLGFRQDYPATSLSFANNAKLTVGDGVHPAALLISTCDGGYSINAGGEIAFGDSEGIIWFRNDQYSGRNISISSPITGNKGLTIASGEQANRPPVITMGTNCAKWTGDLHIVGVRYYIPRSAAVNPGALYIHGGAQKNSAQLALGGECGNATFPIYVCGAGIANSDNSGVIIAYGTTVCPLKSTVTLLGDATFTGGIAYNGVIGGTGKVKIHSVATETREIQFNAANTYVGETEIVNQTLRVGKDGTFGTGKVTVAAGASVIFDGGTKTLGNDIEAASKLTFNGAQLTLTGKVEAKGGLELNGNAALAVKDLTTSSLANGSVTAADAASTLTLDLAEDMVLTTTLNGGAGKLTVVKKGAGKLSIPVGLVTGDVAFEIVEGTVAGLKAIDEPLPNGRLFWLDATQAATTMTLNGDQVTEWRDAGGNGFKFSQYVDSKRTYEYPTLVANGINGKASVDFSIVGASKGNRLVGSATCTPRTVFVVSVARSDMVSCSAVFGQAFSDRNGIRTNNDNWFVAFNYAHFFDCDGFFVNGLMKNSETPLDYGNTQVLAAIKTTLGVANREDTFAPAIGGYCNNGDVGLDRNFNGQVGEVIAYDRVLSTTERQLVENYLAKKWENKEFHVIATPMFPATASVTVSSGATLDLGATDLSVASLDGAGTVASLDGAGKLAVSGAADANLALGDGVTLDVAGTATLKAFNKTAPQGGILWWLDANAADTITTDANGNVTEWASRVTGLSFRRDGSLPVPSYVDGDFLPDGKPGVVFNNGGAQRVRLAASGAATVKTLFIVARPKNIYLSCAGIWGRQNTDSGIRYYWSDLVADLQMTEPGACQFTADDDLRLDGVKMVTGNSGETSGAPFDTSKAHILSCRVEASRTPVSTVYCFGSYHQSSIRSFDGWICESLAYNRVLTDEEVAEVEDYLSSKWQCAGAIPAPNTELGGAVRIGKDATLTVAQGTVATVAAGAGTVNGDITVANPYVITADPDTGAVECLTVNGTATIAVGTGLYVENAVKLAKEWKTFLSATTLEGEFSSISTDDPKPSHASRYQVKSNGTTAEVGRFAGLFIVVQ